MACPPSQNRVRDTGTKVVAMPTLVQDYPQRWPPACSNGACNTPRGSAILTRFERAGVAQLVEHLICNQRVGVSIPPASSTRRCRGSSGNEAERILAVKINGLVSFDTSSICVFTSH